MREIRTYGSVRGALSNERPYRERFPPRVAVDRSMKSSAIGTASKRCLTRFRSDGEAAASNKIDLARAARVPKPLHGPARIHEAPRLVGGQDLFCHFPSSRRERVRSGSMDLKWEHWVSAATDHPRRCSSAASIAHRTYTAPRAGEDWTEQHRP